LPCWNAPNVHVVVASGTGKLAAGERPAAEAEKACHVPSKMKAARGGRG
jgi:hypothetical protein